MTWLTIKEVASLANVDERTVQRHYLEYESRRVDGVGRGGKIIQISLESLPQEVQDRYNGIESKKQSDVYMGLTDKQREAVSFKHCRVFEYKEFKSTYQKADNLQEFLRRYNENHTAHPISKRQLNHWENLYDRDGLKGLVDRRGGYNKGSSCIPEDAWNVFKKLWLQESRPSVQRCYEMTEEYFQDLKLPHISAFKRQLNQIPEPVITRYRYGKKAHEDKWSPYIPRDRTETYPNQQWVADHHLCDVLVKDEREKVCRPWLSTWQDQSSRMIVGFCINVRNPNADIVCDSYARSCRKHGIPDEVDLDNGKDYCTYDMFNTDFALSIANEMKFKVSHALPYNARAKMIERFFGTLEGYFKFLPSYIGNAPHNRPEKMRKLNEKLKDVAMPLDEFKQCVENTIKVYNNSPHSQIDGKIPQEAYISGLELHPPRIVKDEDVLNLMLMRVSKPLKVGRNGVRVPAMGMNYDCKELIPYMGQMVYARYDSDDVRTVLVFTENGDYIGKAESVLLSVHESPFSIERIRDLQHKKKIRNQFIREQMPNVDVPSLPQFVAQKAARYEDYTLPKSRAVLDVSPELHKQAQSIREGLNEESEDGLSKKAVNDTNERKLDKALYALFCGGG